MDEKTKLRAIIKIFQEVLKLILIQTKSENVVKKKITTPQMSLKTHLNDIFLIKPITKMC